MGKIRQRFNKNTVICRMKKCIFLLFTLVLVNCKQTKYKNPHVMLSTSYGEVEIELFPENAPQTVAAFLSYVDSGFYKNSSFYRLLSNENVPPENNTGLIQGGTFVSNPSLLVRLPGIAHEPTSKTHLSHTDGAISLARNNPGTASTEFFICIGDQTQFDAKQSFDRLGFATFGKVINGMDVIRRIQNNVHEGQYFKYQMRILNIERVKEEAVSH